MAIAFEQIPEDIRVPLFYAEVDNTRAGGYGQHLRSLIFGYCGPAANAAQAGKLQPISTVDQARGLFGYGSMLARQVAAFRANNPFGELWVYPLAEPSGGTAATGTVTFAGTAAEAGHVHLYITGKYVPVPIPSGTTAIDAATLVRRYIQRSRNNSDVFRDFPVSATNVVDNAATAVLTFTAKNKGTHGNSIDIRLNYNVETGERLPRGLTATVVAMSGGAGTSDVATMLAAIGDEPFEYFITPFTTAAQLDTFQDWMDARWGPMKQLYGSVWTAHQESYVNLITYGETLNHKQISVACYKGGPTWEPEVGAAYGAVAARYLSIDPARQISSLELQGVMPPPSSQRFTLDEMNNLLFAGLTPLTVGGGDMRIARSVTTYQVNEYDAEDDSFLETTRNASLARIIREVKNMVTLKYPRVKVLPDGAAVGAGAAIVTPRRLRADLVVHYEEMARRGLVRGTDAFENGLVVAINAQDRTRMDILYTPILVNPLNVVATRVQFRF